MIANFRDKTNFPYKLVLTDRQVLKLSKPYASNLSTNLKLQKNKLSKTVQTGEFLGRVLAPLLKNGSPLMKNMLTPLDKNALIPLRFTTAA